MQVKSSLTNATQQQRIEQNQTPEVFGAACVTLSLSLAGASLPCLSPTFKTPKNVLWPHLPNHVSSKMGESYHS
jgi:hypothetical protein